jgi:hypothetical protein
MAEFIALAGKPARPLFESMGTDRSVHAALGVVSDCTRKRDSLGTEWSVPILSRVSDWLLASALNSVVFYGGHFYYPAHFE